MGKKPWEKYMDDVLKGRRLAGELERLSVERCARLMADPRYVFDENEANRVLNIISHFRHTKGKYFGKKFELFPWQSFFFAYIFGLRHRNTDGSPGPRVTRKVLLCMAKKGGKSEIGGAMGVLMTFFDEENGAECYSAANTYHQAGFCWKAARTIVKQLAQESEEVQNSLYVYDSMNRMSIVNTTSDSFFETIASNAKTLDGVNPHYGVQDEYHEAADSSIPDNLESGMVSREQPLLMIVTTRGFNLGGPLFRLEQNYISILRGTSENPSVFPLIFSLDEDDDWEDETVWEKANPGLGRAPTMEGLREEFIKAQTEGASREVSFKTKNLNIWVGTAKTWIKDSNYQLIAQPYTWEDMHGYTCFGGLDLASTNDIAALVLLFPPQGDLEEFRFLTRFWCPEQGAEQRTRNDKVTYLDWAADGYLQLTEGNVTDYETIENEILAIPEQFQIQSIAFDRWNASYLCTRLIDRGAPMIPFAQTLQNFNEPVKAIERLFNSGKINPGVDPVMRWMFGNVAIKEYNNLRRIDKDKSREKVDGPVSLAMAMGEYLNNPELGAMDFDIIWK